MKKWGAIILIALILILTYYIISKANEEEIVSEDNVQSEGWKEVMDSAFEEVDCPTPRNPENLPDSYYRGPMIDTHIHIAHIPLPFEKIKTDEIQPVMGVNVRIADYVCMMDSESTSKSLAFFPVWEPSIREMIRFVNMTLEKYPGRFIPFIMTPDDDGSPTGYPTVNAEKLNEMLSMHPGLFTGYGEIGLYARGDHGGPKGSPELPPNSTRLKEIYPLIGKNNLTIYFHLGERQKEAFEEVLKENRDINFIWHGDQLIPYNNGVQNLQYIDEILSNHENVYYGVDELYGDTFLLKPETSKEEFLAHFVNQEELLEKDIMNWKAFIEKHQNQVIWGTDRGWSAPWSLDPEVAVTLNNYTRAFIGRLSPEAQEKYAYKNAEKLFGT